MNPSPREVPVGVYAAEQQEVDRLQVALARGRVQLSQGVDTDTVEFGSCRREIWAPSKKASVSLGRAGGSSAASRSRGAGTGRESGCTSAASDVDGSSTASRSWRSASAEPAFGLTGLSIAAAAARIGGGVFAQSRGTGCDEEEAPPAPGAPARRGAAALRSSAAGAPLRSSAAGAPPSSR